MTIVEEVADAIGKVAKGIENVRTIVDAIKEGKQYLTVKHPEAKALVAAMLTEMQKTIEVIARASAVLTHFWFTANSEQSLERFNERYELHKQEASTLRVNLEQLRTHCSKIEAHADGIVGALTLDNRTRIFEILGLRSREREQDLADRLSELASADMDVGNTALLILDALDGSLRAVQQALGANRVMAPANIPVAAALLAEHARAFQPLEDRTIQLAADTRALAAALDDGGRVTG